LIDEVEANFETLLFEINKSLEAKSAIGENGHRFAKYVLDTYFENDVFPVKFWNHFDTNSETSNNYVEGDNGKMKLNCGAANPNIFKATDLLIQSDAISINKFIRCNEASDLLIKTVKQ